MRELQRVIVDEMIRGGVREAVLCPGSRNAPLAFALHAADAAGRLLAQLAWWAKALAPHRDSYPGSRRR